MKNFNILILLCTAVPFEDLKKTYCALSLDGKRAYLASDNVTNAQVEDLLDTVRYGLVHTLFYF